MTFRIAAVQPRASSGAMEERNTVAALDWMGRARARGADLVVFPEGFPGPANPANHFDAIGPVRARAAALGLHVVANGLEPAGGNRHFVTSYVIDDTGQIAGRYRRTSPPGPYVYRDIAAWDFDYMASSEPPSVISTRLGKIGVLTCSEVYVPELTRLLTLQGADLVVYPSGGAINELMDTWRTVVWARAIENLVYTVAVQNIYDDEEVGVGTLASPEAVVASLTHEGMLIADVDTERLAYLRGRDEHIEFPKPYRTPPGLLRWRRPELYGALTATGHRTGPATSPA